MKKIIYIGIFMLGCFGRADAMSELPQGPNIFTDVDQLFQVEPQPRTLYANYLENRNIILPNIRITGEDFVVNGTENGLGLFNAISNGDIEAAANLLMENETFITMNGLNPLMMAAERGFVELVDIAAENHDINGVSEIGDTAMMIAMRSGQSDMVLHLLMNMGADPNIQNELGTTLFLLAASRGADDVLSAIVPTEADAPTIEQYVNQADHTGRNALWHAISGEQGDMFRNLLEIGVDADAINDEGETIGHLLRQLEDVNPDVMRAMWDMYSAALEQYISNVNNQQSATRGLFWAVREEANAYAEQLIGLADLDAVDERGETVAMIAARTGNVEIMRQLISAGVNLEQHNPGGQTLILVALYHRQFEIADMLSQSGANMQAVDNDGLSVEDYVRFFQD